eukprot:GHVQ01024791.1.p2 GENE.GHVQ01024791.1~~GHVQ01024791.1.p2  ORF type:complete len:459 (-),score=61.00 GHVQ01024791.1:2581-3957(-)
MALHAAPHGLRGAAESRYANYKQQRTKASREATICAISAFELRNALPSAPSIASKNTSSAAPFNQQQPSESSGGECWDCPFRPPSPLFYYDYTTRPLTHNGRQTLLSSKSALSLNDFDNDTFDNHGTLRFIETCGSHADTTHVPGPTLHEEKKVENSPRWSALSGCAGGSLSSSHGAHSRRRRKRLVSRGLDRCTTVHSHTHTSTADSPRSVTPSVSPLHTFTHGRSEGSRFPPVSWQRLCRTEGWSRKTLVEPIFLQPELPQPVKQQTGLDLHRYAPVLESCYNLYLHHRKTHPIQSPWISDSVRSNKQHDMRSCYTLCRVMADQIDTDSGHCNKLSKLRRPTYGGPQEMNQSAIAESDREDKALPCPGGTSNNSASELWRSAERPRLGSEQQLNRMTGSAVDWSQSRYAQETSGRKVLSDFQKQVNVYSDTANVPTMRQVCDDIRRFEKQAMMNQP